MDDQLTPAAERPGLHHVPAPTGPSKGSCKTPTNASEGSEQSGSATGQRHKGEKKEETQDARHRQAKRTEADHFRARPEAAASPHRGARPSPQEHTSTVFERARRT